MYLIVFLRNYHLQKNRSMSNAEDIQLSREFLGTPPPCCQEEQNMGGKRENPRILAKMEQNKGVY